MNPIFNEYIEYLKDNDINLGLNEGYYWLDRQIIKCFSDKGEVIKVARLLVDEDLKVRIKTVYKNKDYNVESWKETANRFKSNLDMIELESIVLINSQIEKHIDKQVAVLSSGGKDSQVTSYLVKKCFDSPSIIFNNTTLDSFDTYIHIKKEDNLTIINPDEGFYQWRKRLNFIPTRFARACCSIFKEGAMVEKLPKEDKYIFFMGMRNEESANRSSYVDEWRNDKWGDREWYACLPIRKWSELELWLYIIRENIDINPKYKKGYSRCGCLVACPFYSKSTWSLDKYWYPKQHNRWKDILREDFRKNNKDLIMNCTEEEYFTCWNGGQLRKEPTKEVISGFASRNNFSYEQAEGYFGHKCYICEKQIKDKDLISMNLKLNEEESKFYCKKHLLLKYGLNKEDYKNYIDTYKNSGCFMF